MCNYKKIISTKFLKIVAIIFLILMFASKSYSICNDSIPKNNKFKVHYKFGVSFLYMSPIINKWNNAYIISMTNNSYGISLSHDLCFLPKFNINVSLEYADNYSKVEYRDYTDNQSSNFKESSFLLSIPVRINYSIVTLKKCKFTLGVGANFKNTQEVHIKGDSYDNNAYSKFDTYYHLKIRDFFIRDYWHISESNCIGMDYYLKKHLSIRLLISFNLSTTYEKFLLGTNLGIVF